MRKVWILLTAGAAALAAPMLVAGPAGAGLTCSGSAQTAPDATIKVNDGPAVGRHVYSTTTADVNLLEGHKVRFTMKWKNRSGSTRTIRVADTGAGGDENIWRTKFFVGGVKQPESHFNFAFRNIPPGGSTPTIDYVVKSLDFQPLAKWDREVAGRFKGAADGVCDQLVAHVDAITEP